MMTPTDTLCAIERNAARANPQELRIMMRDVRSMRAQLDEDDLEHADVLLLKLERLLREQQVVAA